MATGTEPGFEFDKAAFFEDLGYHPHDGQRPIHESRALRRVVACGVRFGKSVCAAHEALAAAMAAPGDSRGWIVAPTYDLADKVFREVVIVAHTRLAHRVIELRESERRIVLRNLAGGKSEIKAKSADNPVSLLGEGLDYLIIDEAARLKPSIFQSYLSQRLIDKKGWALIISTPRGKGWFYDLFQRGQRGKDPDFESWNLPSWTNPLLDREFLEHERARLPDRVFNQEFGGEFLEGAGQVFRGIRDVATGTLKGYEPGQRYVMGLDLAKSEDFTVLIGVNVTSKEVAVVDRFHRVDWSTQVARVKATTDRYGRPTIYTDTTGIGEPIYEALRRENLNVSPYLLNAQSKAALINNLMIRLEQKTITLPKPELAPDLIDELEAFEYSVSDSGNTSMSAPSGVHDDCVIALALAAWGVKSYSPHCGVRFL